MKMSLSKLFLYIVLFYFLLSFQQFARDKERVKKSYQIVFFRTCLAHLYSKKKMQNSQEKTAQPWIEHFAYLSFSERKKKFT